MDILRKLNIKTKEEARQYAIDWQVWQSERSMSYGQIAEWTYYFLKLAKRFNLTSEFLQNGII